MISRSLAAGLPVLLGVFLLACREDPQIAAECLPGDASLCHCADGSRPQCATLQDCFCDAVLSGEGGAPPLDSGPPDSAIAADAGTDASADAGDGPDLSCGVQTSTATIKDARPVDVIFVIDNSGSMSGEIAAVEANINDNFARILDQTQADYRVIMLSHHGGSGSQQICIKAPLSGTSCSPLPTAPVNTARFFHYDQDIQSTDSWCWLLDTFDRRDQHGFTTTGWQAWLRPSALKVFVEVSDDGINCSSPRGTFYQGGSGEPLDDSITMALAFNDALLRLSPAQFGTSTRPNYVWHSIIGMKANTPAELPWVTTDPFQTGVCPTASDPGGGYQILSTVSGGLRYPVCEGKGFETIFRAIARDVAEGAGAECRFRIPQPPAGKYIDMKSISVEYSSGGGAPRPFARAEAAACNDSSFIVADQDVALCDAACARVRQDKSAKLQVTYKCGAENVLK